MGQAAKIVNSFRKLFIEGCAPKPIEQDAANNSEESENNDNYKSSKKKKKGNHFTMLGLWAGLKYPQLVL